MVPIRLPSLVIRLENTKRIKLFCQVLQLAVGQPQAAAGKRFYWLTGAVSSRERVEYGTILSLHDRASHNALLIVPIFVICHFCALQAQK
jgi:hypothetical protein